MLHVGITGGIGSGKSALTDWLATQDIVIVEADLDVVRRVAAPSFVLVLGVVRVRLAAQLRRHGARTRAHAGSKRASARGGRSDGRCHRICEHTC